MFLRQKPKCNNIFTISNSNIEIGPVYTHGALERRGASEEDAMPVVGRGDNKHKLRIPVPK